MTKVRCMETGRFYTNRRYLEQAKKQRKFVEEHREEQMLYLQAAVSKSFGKVASRKRSFTMKEKHRRRPDLAENSRKMMSKLTHDPEVIRKRAIGREKAREKLHTHRDGKRVIKVVECEREKSTGVVYVS